MSFTGSKSPPPPPQWVLDLNTKSWPKTKPDKILDPPGFSSGTVSKKSATKQQPIKRPSREETDTLKLKKAWEVALGPAKSLPMNAIMMYMSGNTLQIFSIMMVFMLFKGPVQAILQMNEIFARFETDSTKGKFLLVKITYVLMNIIALSLGIWKVNGMGLLPTTRSDWLAWETERIPLENTIFAFK